MSHPSIPLPALFIGAILNRLTAISRRVWCGWAFVTIGMTGAGAILFAPSFTWRTAMAALGMLWPTAVGLVLIITNANRRGFSAIHDELAVVRSEQKAIRDRLADFGEQLGEVLAERGIVNSRLEELEQIQDREVRARKGMASQMEALKRGLAVLAADVAGAARTAAQKAQGNRRQRREKAKTAEAAKVNDAAVASTLNGHETDVQEAVEQAAKRAYADFYVDLASGNGPRIRKFPGKQEPDGTKADG